MRKLKRGRILGPALILCATAVLLAGCFFIPGRFVSSLDLAKDGQFTFAYKGELHFLPLTNSTRDGGAEFTPDECYDEDTYETHDCSAAEIAEQKADWENARKEASDKKEQEAREMAQMLGSIDPNDPDAQQKFAQLLQRQAGWKSVVAKGNGLFDVDYQMTGRIGHAFTFPIVEGFALTNPIVSVLPRADGTVRVDATGFGPALGNPMGMMLFGAQSLSGGSPSAMPDEMPKIDGQFTLRTNGQILANNTDEGPQTITDGSNSLNWKVDARTTAAPMALIRLSR